jgi:hypothetical protein
VQEKNYWPNNKCKYNNKHFKRKLEKKCYKNKNNYNKKRKNQIELTKNKQNLKIKIMQKKINKIKIKQIINKIPLL